MHMYININIQVLDFSDLSDLVLKKNIQKNKHGLHVKIVKV